MNDIFLILSFLISWRLAKKHGFFSPSSMFSWVATINLLMYYLISVKGIYIDLISNWWQVRRDFSAVHGKVSSYYFGLSCIGLMAATRFGRASHQKKGKKSRVSKSKQKLTGGSETKNIAVINAASQDSNINKNIDKALMSGYAIGILFFLLFIDALHLSTLDFNKILYYREYLSIRNDPSSIGVTNNLAAYLHKSLPVLGAVISIVAVFYWRRKAWYHFFITTLIAGYSLLFSISFNSRFSVLQIAFIGFAVFMTRKGKSSVNLLPFAWGILAFFVYAALLYQRQMKSFGLGNFGLAPFFDIILSGNFLSPDIFFFFVFNVFSGCFLLADAFISPPFSYPLKYKLLAIFSPFPSAIDKFSKVEYYKTLNKAALTSPYSSFSEAYFFGALYTVIFLLLIFFALRLFNHIWYKFPGGYTFLLVAPAYYCFLRMQTYPIRNTERFLLLSMFLCFGLIFYTNRKNKAKAELRKNPSYRALGPSKAD